MRSLHALTAALVLAFTSCFANAQPWIFSDPVDVTTVTGAGIFHHLESSGRRNIAVSGDVVAVAWEDNRDGKPAIYLARKHVQDKSFGQAIKISGDGEAFEPSLVALDAGQFAVAWEEAEKIHARLVSTDGPGPAISLGGQPGYQASLARHNQQLLLVYSQMTKQFQRIQMQILAVMGNALKASQACSVETAAPVDDQLYPTAISLDDHILVAWEDRRPGHTIIMAARSNAISPCQFTPPQRISEAMPSRGNYGKGHGVARVALARYGAGKAVAIWADKRDFREGYDIYASFYQAGNKNLFGPNSKVQDSFGGLAQQWHPAVAGDSSGRVVATWDDKRDGDANILLSWPVENGWSDDLSVPGASSAGEQQHPSVCLDQQGNLHMVWLHRDSVGGPTRIRYGFGKIAGKPTS